MTPEAKAAVTRVQLSGNPELTVAHACTAVLLDFANLTDLDVDGARSVDSHMLEALLARKRLWYLGGRRLWRARAHLHAARSTCLELIFPLCPRCVAASASPRWR